MTAVSDGDGVLACHLSNSLRGVSYAMNLRKRRQIAEDSVKCNSQEHELLGTKLTSHGCRRRGLFEAASKIYDINCLA